MGVLVVLLLLVVVVTGVKRSQLLVLRLTKFDKTTRVSSNGTRRFHSNLRPPGKNLNLCLPLVLLGHGDPLLNLHVLPYP